MKKGILFIISALLTGAIMAQSSGVYPAEPFNGMQVSYSITGATISKYTDVPGFTCTRSLVITGIQNGGVLGISGTLQAGGLGCTITVSVSAGSKSSSGTYEVQPGNPKSFQQTVNIPKDAKTASISVRMDGHYSMGGGHRGVVLQGDWSERWGAENKPAEPDKYKPKPSLVAVLKDIMKVYTDEKKIPRGLVSNGPDNNKLWWFGNKYDEFVCGSYQAKVLKMLEDMKFSTNEAERKLMDDYDFGPIETNCGIIPGGHQAVVIYPKGTNWKETGTILDPWPEQRPKSYTIEEWKKIFPHGMKSSGYYKGQYPNCGGSGYTDPRKTVLTPAEDNWYKSLPGKSQEGYRNIRDASERKRRIKIGYANREQTARAAADCPLNVYLIDRAGRISGFPGGTLRTDIPGVSVNTFQLADGTYWTELAYPASSDYTLVFKGTGNGLAEVYSGFNMQDDPAGRAVYKYSFNVNNGQEYALDQGQENAAIRILAGKNKKGEITGSRVASPGEQGMATTGTGPEEKIFDNGNIYGVTNGPSSPTKFVLSQPTFISRIENYHYFNNGRSPGTITLVNNKGDQFGPWYATGTTGQGGVQNAYWVVRPDMTLPAGTYTVIDSDPATWSTNSQSGNKGFTTVWARGR